MLYRVVAILRGCREMTTGFIMSRILSCDLYVDNICNANYVPYGDEQLRSVKYGGNFIAAQASAPVFVGAGVAAKS